MGGGPESRCVGRVYGLDGAVHHHSSTNWVQKTICCNLISNAPDDGRLSPKHVELRKLPINHIVASSWHFTLFQIKAYSVSMCVDFAIFCFVDLNSVDRTVFMDQLGNARIVHS